MLTFFFWVSWANVNHFDTEDIVIIVKIRSKLRKSKLKDDKTAVDNSMSLHI